MLAARRLPKQLGESLPHGGANSAYKYSGTRGLAWLRETTRGLRHCSVLWSMAAL